MMSLLQEVDSPLAIRVSGLSKRFPGVTALNDVSLDFAAGQITAVLGENGAGKSTLMTILAGLQSPEVGTVTVGSVAVTVFTPSALLHQHGVALVPQEIALCMDRTVAENILMGKEGGLFPSRSRINEVAAGLLDQIETAIDPRQNAGQLTVADQQLVLIVRALARDCRVLILDEPTTSLTPREVARLFSLLKRLRAEGTTIIYVSHRLPEIFELSDSVHVLRDGRHVRSFETKQASSEVLIAAMVGRELAERTVGRQPEGDVVLRVRNLSGFGFNDVSFEVRRGEVLGVAGLPDSGRSEVVAALFGVEKSAGSIVLDGRSVSFRSPREAMRRGVGYVPAERRSQAIFPDMSVADNSTILEVDLASRFGVVRRGILRRLASERLAEYEVRGSGKGRITGLSGGNQQKVILARWLARKPRLLLLDDPTRGVDVGAKSEIYDRLHETARDGAAVLMASSDLPELLRVCDRIMVLAGGHVAGIVEAQTATEEQVMTLATGMVSVSR